MRPAAGLALHVVVAMFLFGSASSQGSTPLLREEEEASVGHCNPAYVSIPNALARARALRPPVPVCTYGGEHEANDFWDKRHKYHLRDVEVEDTLTILERCVAEMPNKDSIFGILKSLYVESLEV